MASDAQIVAPRPSASLVVVNDRNEILLVHRSPKATSFSGMHVFPGGNSDAQDASHEMTAIRETFEETGLLFATSDLTSPSALSDDILDSARTSIHEGKLLFKDFLAQHRLKADVSSLLPFSQWVTPPPGPRRFHTHFFVAFLPTSSSTGFSSGHVQQRLPTPDGGQEIVEARFVHPADALAEFAAGRVSFMPPQFYLLTTLADMLRGRGASAAERARVEVLSRGAFGRMVIHPQRYTGPEVPEGYVCLTYEGDKTRAGPKGWMHRSYIRFVKGTPTEIKLERNFDPFTDLVDRSNDRHKL